MLLNLPPEVLYMLIGAGVLFLVPVVFIYVLSNLLR